MTLRERLGRVHWYARELAGETAYERYVEHRARVHPDEPVMTQREFWRWRMDERTKNPSARCC